MLSPVFSVTFSFMNVVLLFLFFLSGAVGLVYEILWVRTISIVTGAGDFSVTIIIGIFMIGLAAGGFIAGRFVDRICKRSRLLLLYGILEILTGVYVLVLPLLFKTAEPAFSAIYNRLGDSMFIYGLAGSGLVFLLLIIPCTLMGAGLPVLCRWAVRSTERSGRITGLMYGVNTIGAAAGVLGCWYILIYICGMQRTQVIAACVNLVIGILCLCLCRVQRGQKCKSLSENNESSQGSVSKADRGIWFILFVSAFCTMAYEVIWTRLLGLLVGPTTYSFTIILFSFILGIGAGSVGFGWLSDRVKHPFLLIVGTQLAVAVFALGLSQFLGGGQLFFAKILYSGSDNFTSGTIMIAVVITIMLLPVTLCMGAVFPVASKIRISNTGTTGSETGNNYCISTIGSVAGAFCAGFLLLPMMGKAHSISFTVMIQVLAVAVFTMTKRAMFDRRELSAILAICVVLTGGSFFVPRWNAASLTRARYQRFSEFEHKIMNSSFWVSVFRGDSILTSNQPHEDVLFLADGAGGFVSVNSSIDSLGVTNLTLTTSGKKDASTVVDVRTQVLSGHIPMLFSKSADDVMIVGLGSGMTAGEVLNYPVKRLDILEISPEVVSACDFFKPWNNGVLEDSRANIISQDARVHLTLTDRKYDVIISEPSNCWLAGMANLFTVDFFLKVRKRLKNRGVFEQWLYSYQMTWEDFSMITRSLNSVFPNSILFRTGTSGPDYLILSFLDSDAVLDMENARQRLQYLNGSSNIKLSAPELLCSLIVSDDLSSFSSKGVVHTDDRPCLEYSAPRNINKWQGELSHTIADRGSIRSGVCRVSNGEPDVENQIEMAKCMVSLRVSPFGIVDRTLLSGAQVKVYDSIVESYSSKNMVTDYFSIRDVVDRQICASVHREKILTQISGLMKTAIPAARMGTIFHDLGNTYLVAGKYHVAARCYRQSLSYLPDNPVTIYALGIALQAVEDYAGAIDTYQRLVRLNIVSDRISKRLADCRQKFKTSSESATGKGTGQ